MKTKNLLIDELEPHMAAVRNILKKRKAKGHLDAFLKVQGETVAYDWVI